MTHMEEPAALPAVTDPPASTSLVRAKRKVRAVGERHLVERLHRVLNEGGLDAHKAFCDRLLPHLQELVTLLPDRLTEDAQPAAMETMRTLPARSRLGGVTPRDIMAEGIALHDRLWQEILPHFCDNDRTLAAVLSNLSQALLEMGRDALSVAEQGAPPAAAQEERFDAETGLAGREYLEARFGEEILRAQRSKRALTLILLDVAGTGMAHSAGSNGQSAEALPSIAAALLAQTRGIDLVARIQDCEFALLLPETTRTGAAALLSRLAQDNTGRTGRQVQEPPLPFKAGIAVYPKDGKTVHELMRYAHNVLHQGQQALQP